MQRLLTRRRLLPLLTGLAAALLVPTGVAVAKDGRGRDATRGTAGAVYAQTNGADANRILAYQRRADGRLSQPASYDTGGRGTGLIRTSSQGPVHLAPNGRTLVTVNQGSNDVSVFRVRRDRLELIDRVPSGGVRPFSITQRGRLFYVLNNGNVAGGAPGLGNITGFRLRSDGQLRRLRGSTRGLSQVGADPAEVGFTPGGRRLVVTEKATNRIDTFKVGKDGYASRARVHRSAGRTPFGFDFTRRGQFIVSDAAGGDIGQATASSYRLGARGRLTTISGAVPDGRSEVCWTVITNNDRFAYITNFGDGTISSYRVARDGSITLHESVAATTTPGSLSIRDAGLSKDGRYLYAIDIETRTVHAWRVDQTDGSLTPIGAFAGLPGTVAGLAAS